MGAGQAGIGSDGDRIKVVDGRRKRLVYSQDVRLERRQWRSDTTVNGDGQDLYGQLDRVSERLEASILLFSLFPATHFYPLFFGSNPYTCDLN